MAQLPTFAQLKPNYLLGKGSDVLRTIGGKIGNLDPGTNTCVMRMSRAFNYAGKGFEIPPNSAQLRSLPGADGKNYAYNVQDFLAYLRRVYGPPSITMKYEKDEKESSRPFLTKTGIIAWHIKGWSDATGHFTLWDGSTGLYEGEHDYFVDFPITVDMGHGKAHTIRETQADLWIC